MINVVIDKSGSMNALGKSDVIHSIVRELQLTEGIECTFYSWGENLIEISGSDEHIDIKFDGKSSIQTLLDFIKLNTGTCLVLTDGFSNEDKANLTSYLRDNPNSKFRVILVGADSRLINGKSFFPENLMATEQDKYIFSSIEVSAAVESLCF